MAVISNGANAYDHDIFVLPRLLHAELAGLRSQDAGTVYKQVRYQFSLFLPSICLHFSLEDRRSKDMMRRSSVTLNGGTGEGSIRT